MADGDKVQLVMTRYAAMSISNMASLGYLVALHSAGYTVDAQTLADAIVGTVELLHDERTTREELQAAFDTLSKIPRDEDMTTIQTDRRGAERGT